MSRCMLRTSMALAGFSLLAVGWQSDAAADDSDVLMIEEHWELSVGGPDIARTAPQVSMVMSPTGDLDEEFFVVTINHGSFPEFNPGGVQVQHWCGDACVSARNSYSKHSLHHDGEVVSWTQRMELDGCSLKFEVVDGASDSFGTFGNVGVLQDTIYTERSRLNTYVPAISLTESGIGFAGNRVSGLTLQKLVWVTRDGQRHELNAPIDISTGLDP